MKQTLRTAALCVSVLACGCASPTPDALDVPLTWEAELEWSRGGANDSTLQLRDGAGQQSLLATSAKAEYAVGDLPSCNGAGLSSYPLVSSRIA